MSQSFKVNEIFWGAGPLRTLCKAANIRSSKLIKVKNGLAVLCTVSQSYFLYTTNKSHIVSEYLVYCEIFLFKFLTITFLDLLLFYICTLKILEEGKKKA